MIDSAISHIASQLNQFLKDRFYLAEDIVVISNILEQDGNISPHIENKLVVFLVNIEKDTVPQRRPNGVAVGNNRAVVNYPPVYLNLYLMFAAHFSGSNYPEALKFISNTVSFFQSRPLFDHRNSPDLDRRIDQLTMNIENLTMHDLGTLWGVLSSRYMPSILYKVRMVIFDAEAVQAQVPAIKEIQTLTVNES